MRFDPLFTAPLPIQVHMAFAVIALLLGPVALFRNRRDRLHRITGYIWAIGIAGLALTGLVIKSDFAVIGRFGPIHLFSLLALWGLYEGITQARQGNYRAHQKTMTSLWFAAIGITGLLTLLPGRTLNRTVFGEPSAWSLPVIALGFAGLFWLWLRMTRPGRRSVTFQ